MALEMHKMIIFFSSITQKLSFHTARMSGLNTYDNGAILRFFLLNADA